MQLKEEYFKKFENLSINAYKKRLLRDRLNNYISNAIERTDYYENLIWSFFKINLSILLASITILTFLSNNLTNPIPIFIYVGFIGFILISIINLFYVIMLEKRTNFDNEDLRKTYWFYRGNVPPKNIPTNLERNLFIFSNRITNSNEGEFIKDDLKNLFILYYYASHRYNIVKNSRRITVIGITFFITSFLSQFFTGISTNIQIGCKILIFGIIVIIIWIILKSKKEIIEFLNEKKIPSEMIETQILNQIKKSKENKLKSEEINITIIHTKEEKEEILNKLKESGRLNKDKEGYFKIKKT